MAWPFGTHHAPLPSVAVQAPGACQSLSVSAGAQLASLSCALDSKPMLGPMCSNGSPPSQAPECSQPLWVISLVLCLPIARNSEGAQTTNKTKRPAEVLETSPMSSTAPSFEFEWPQTCYPIHPQPSNPFISTFGPWGRCCMLTIFLHSNTIPARAFTPRLLSAKTLTT